MSKRIIDLLDHGSGLKGPLFDTLAARLARPPQALDAGQRIGPYRILHALGQGGMASVYLAERDDGEFEQRVALKVVSVEHGQVQRGEILKRERQILARLQHPRIARLLDGGTTAEGRIWFAMEPVAGERIDAWCANQRLDSAARARLFLQVCEAVAFAHAQLLVHRDIKPANILVDPHSGVKLLDFGIAGMLATDRDSSEAPRALSPGFASPEQIAGAAVGTASDIWQLGRLLLAMLDSGIAPGSAPARPPDLDAIIAMATATDAAARYPTVNELGADLQRYLSREPVRARRGGALYRLGLLLSRRRYAVAAGVAALAAFATMGIHFTMRMAEQRDVAVQAAERATATSEFLVSLFQTAQPNVNQGESLTASRLIELGEQRLASQLLDQPALRASLLATIAEVHLGIGQYDRAEAVLTEAVQIGRGDPQVDQVQLAVRLRDLARAQWRLDRFDAALRSAQESESLIGDRDDQVELRVLLRNTQGAIAIRLADYAQAIDIEQQAIALARSRLPPGNRPLAYAHNNLATAYRATGRHAEALEQYTEALQVLRRVVGEDHTDMHAIASERAYQLALLGRHDEAITEATAALASLGQLLGTTSGIALANAQMVFASTLLAAGTPEEALQPAFDALQALRERAGADALATASAAFVHGKVLVAMGREQEALADLRDTLRIRNNKLARAHDQIAEAAAALGIALCRTGDSAEGQRLLQQALAIYAALEFAADARIDADAVLRSCAPPPTVAE